MIVILSDFGLEDPYVGIMKGVIRQISPTAEIMDLTHGIPAQQIMIASMVLSHSLEYFPAGTIVLAVVDPGVGSERKGVAIKCGPFYLVGPDNGLFSFVNDSLYPSNEIRTLNNPKFYRTPVPEPTFHGRDIFAPVAAWLDRGIDFVRVGDQQIDLVRLPRPLPRPESGRIRVPLLMIDHFGNLIFALTRKEFLQYTGIMNYEIHYRGKIVTSLSPYYQASHQSGKATGLMALFNSYGLLELAIRNGSAAALTETSAPDGEELILCLIPGSEK